VKLLAACSIGLYIGLLSMRSVYRTAAGGAEISVEDYFRISVYYPTLDNIVSDVELRFGPTQRKAAKLACTSRPTI